MYEIETIKKYIPDNGDTIKLKDATTKLLALARHLLSYAPGIRPPKEERPLLAVTEEVNDY
jgi:hypothetical protein